MPQLVPTSLGNDYLAAKAKDALRMEEKGMPAGLIFDASNVVRTPGGYMDVVTSDISNPLDMVDLAAALKKEGGNPVVGDYVYYPELYKAYPDAGSVTAELNPNLKAIKSYGAFEHGYNNIALLYPTTNPNRAAVLTHEMQHKLDYDGANNSRMMRDYLKGIREDYGTNTHERRAFLVEMADKLGDSKAARQAIFDVVSGGLPATVDKTEDAVLAAAARNAYLNAKANKKGSK